MKHKTNSSYNQRLIIGILILAPALLFLRTLTYDFSPMDEQWLIIKKFNYLKNWGNLWNTFTQPVADMYYRPLLTISFIIDAHLGGLKPLVYHVTNLALHIFCVLLLYRLLRMLKTDVTTALLFALLFSIHPALTHAVVWVPGRNDVLLCLFSLLSFIYLLKYIETHSPYALPLHVLFFACALLSKETAIVLPLIYLGLLYCSQPFSKRYLLPVACWLIAGLCWFLIKRAVLPATVIPGSKDLLSILQNMGPAFLIYTGKLIWPFSSSVTPTVQNSSLLAGGITLILLSVMAFVPGVKNKKIAGLGALLFFAGLVLPVFFGASSILGEHYEHRIYLPFAGFIIFASQLNFNFGKGYARPVFIVLIAALAVKTFIRSEVYGSDLNYVNEGVEDCPKNYVFHFLKGNILYNKHELAEALPCFNKAIALQPNRIQPLTNRANVYTEMGEKELAIADLEAAQKLGANAYVFLTKVTTYYRFEDYDNALLNFKILAQFGDNYLNLLPPKVLQKLTELNTQSTAPGNMAGTKDNTYLQTDNQKNLIGLTNAIKNDPSNAVFYVYRAKTFVDLKKWPEALADLKKACELEPDNKEYKGYYDELNTSMPH